MSTWAADESTPTVEAPDERTLMAGVDAWTVIITDRIACAYEYPDSGDRRDLDGVWLKAETAHAWLLKDVACLVYAPREWDDARVLDAVLAKAAVLAAGDPYRVWDD